MAKKISFLSMANASQPVNQYLCVALMSVVCLWTVVYYLNKTADIVNDTFASVGEYAD
ncbi:MAG: hypothetical protein V4481_01485 [Patescibacteria group bacterium]